MTRFARAIGRGADERGFTIVEVLAALGIFALVSVGLATTMNASLGLSGRATSRQNATQLASVWIEESRATDYTSGLGLDGSTTWEASAGSPDHDVTGTPPGYGGETLVMLPAGQGLLHHDVQESNGRAYELYRYVTWVPDNSLTPPDPYATKRVTIIVQWAGTDTAGKPNRVVVSTIVASGTVSWGGTTSTSAPGPTTTSAPAPTTTAPPSTTTTSQCAGDVTPPSGTSVAVDGMLRDGVKYVNSTPVLLALSATDPCAPLQYRMHNEDTSTFPDSWSPLGDSATWAVTAGDGTKTVSVQFQDGAGNQTGALAVSFIVDTVKPTTPSGVGASKTGSAKVTINWSASTDANLSGYRIYRKIGSGQMQNLGVNPTFPCTSCSYVDNSVTNNNSYTYYVQAVDAAGNASDPSTNVSVTL